MIPGQSRFASTSWSRHSTTWPHARSVEVPRNNKPVADRAPRRPGAKAKSSFAAEIIAAARDLAWGGQHAQAVELVTSALEKRGDDVDRLALLELRAESLDRESTSMNASQ